MANELERSKPLHIGKNVTEDMINPENMKLLKKYDRDMQMRELSGKSIYSYICDLKAWFRYIYEEQYNQCVKDLTEDDIEEMIFMCKEHGNNTERIKRRMASISAFYKFLRRKKEITENPCEFIARPKKGLPVVVQTFLTKEQYEDIKKKLVELGDLQLQTYVLLSISTMARVNAISNIMWEQIDFENRTIDDVLEKEGKIVTLFFSEEVKELLLKLKKTREDEGINVPYVFITKYQGEYKKVETGTLGDWTKKVGEMIGVPSLHPHDYRHSGAQLMNLAGCPIETISSLLNHSGLDVTKNHYLRQDKTKMQKEKDKYSM